MGYANPPAIIAVSVFFPVIGAVAVALRFYTRHYMRAKPTLDDWLIVPAWVILCVLGGLMIWGATTDSLGLPIPKPNVPGPEGFVFSWSPEQGRFLMIQYLMDLLSVWGLGFIKLSILFFYQKIFCGAGVRRTMFYYTTYFMIGLIIIWTVAFGFGFIFICQTDFSAAWGTLAGLKKHCSSLLRFLQGFGISDFITDALIMILPIPKIWSLHMSIRQRLAIIAVFLVGILTLAASCTRMTIWNLYIVDAFSQPDGETLVTVLLFWSMVESGLGVLVACLPTLRPLFARFFSEGVRTMFSTRWPTTKDSESSSLRPTPSKHRHNYNTSYASTFSTEPKSSTVLPGSYEPRCSCKQNGRQQPAYGFDAYASRAI